MRWRAHRRAARMLARLMGLDARRARRAELGAIAPDLDLFVGRHRHTLHGPLLLAVPDPSFQVGVVSHLILDKLGSHLRRASRRPGRALRGRGARRAGGGAGR
jgi:hypothetical protein